MFNAVGGFEGNPVEFGLLDSQGHAFCGLFVELLGHRRGAAHTAQSFDHDGFGQRALAHSEGVAHAYLACGLDILAVDLHAVLGNFVAGQAAGFVKPRGPQPFVNAHTVHVLALDDIQDVVQIMTRMLGAWANGFKGQVLAVYPQGGEAIPSATQRVPAVA